MGFDTGGSSGSGGVGIEVIDEGTQSGVGTSDNKYYGGGVGSPDMFVRSQVALQDGQTRSSDIVFHEGFDDLTYNRVQHTPYYNDSPRGWRLAIRNDTNNSIDVQWRLVRFL